MTDWTSLPLGADASHYQGQLDYDVLIADGFVGPIILKATQGMHTDPDFVANRDEAIRRDVPWLAYAYLMPSDTPATVANFLSVAGPGAVAALDWEEAGVPNRTVEIWMDEIEAAPGGRPGLVYYGKWPPAPVTDRIARWPRWLPDYPARIEDGPNLPPWGGSPTTDWSQSWLVWQSSGTARLPGMTTAIDLNRLACSLDAFKQWLATGVLPTTAPAALPLIPAGETLFIHCSGDAVRMLQQRLAALGYVVAADAQYGPQTRAAVTAFQIDHHLTPVDGIAGPITIAAINGATT